MLIPAVNIKWIYQHSACFVRDIPPQEISNGCYFLLFMLFVLMSVGVLGMSVASADARDKSKAFLYRILTAISCFFTLILGLMFWVYAQPDFNSVSSTVEMSTVRSWGYSSGCIREKMLNHAFKDLLGNSCREVDAALTPNTPWYYEMFSCTSCDKTSPNSCKGSVRATTQQEFTGFAALGFLVRAAADAYGFICACGVVIYNERVEREQT
jgi:hypothetical protein